jgi:GAF domain-containing protein
VTQVITVIRDISARNKAQQVLEQRATQLALVNDISRQIAATLDLDSVLDRAAHLVQEHFGYHYVALCTVDREQHELVMQARTGDFAHLFPPGHRLEPSKGIAGDVAAESRYINPYPDVINTRSELCVPIRLGEQVLGILDVQSPQPNAFDEHDVTVMETLADQIAIAIENARLYETVQRELADRE